MKDADRFQLRFGKYKTPTFRYGTIVQCAVFGEVKIVGLSDAPIPWPIGLKGGNRTQVVYKDLAKARRAESNLAVAHWWESLPRQSPNGEGDSG